MSDFVLRVIGEWSVPMLCMMGGFGLGVFLVSMLSFSGRLSDEEDKHGQF